MSRIEGDSVFSSSMMGLIVVILVGTGLAVVVKQRFEYSKGLLEFQRDSQATQVELSEVRERHETTTQRLLRSEAKVSAQINRQQFFSSERLRLNSRRAELVNRQEILEESVTRLTAEFSNQLSENRQKAREDAIGQKLDSLVLRSGRSYSEVTIFRVTDQGLEIRHSDGTARISAQDLEEPMELRFQWAVAKP